MIDGARILLCGVSPKSVRQVLMRAMFWVEHIALRHVLTTYPMVCPRKDRMLVHIVCVEQKWSDLDYALEFLRDSCHERIAVVSHQWFRHVPALNTGPVPATCPTQNADTTR